MLPVSSWSGSSPTASTLDWRPWKSSPSCRRTRPLPQSSSTWRASGLWHVWWRAAPSEWTGCTSLSQCSACVLSSNPVWWGKRGWFLSCSFGEMLAFTLTAFLELMDHGIVSWDLISLSFIKQVPPQPQGSFSRTSQLVSLHRLSAEIHGNFFSSLYSSFMSFLLAGSEWVLLPSYRSYYADVVVDCVWTTLTQGKNTVPLTDVGFQKRVLPFANERPEVASSSSPLSTLRSQATWTSPWWTCPSCSARSPSWRAWCSTVTVCTTEWLRRSPWDSSSGTCKCEHTHTHRGVTHSDGRRGRLPFVEGKPTML